MSVKRTRQNASQLANKHQCLKSAADPQRSVELYKNADLIQLDIATATASLKL